MAKPLPGRFNIKFQTWLNHKIWYQDHFQFWWCCWKVENKTNFQWKIDTKYRKVNYVHFIWRPTYKWSPWHKSYFFSIDLIFWDFLSAGSYSPGYWQSTNRSKACFDANIFPNYLPVPIDKQHLCQSSFISWDITSNWFPWC